MNFRASFSRKRTDCVVVTALSVFANQRFRSSYSAFCIYMSLIFADIYLFCLLCFFILQTNVNFTARVSAPMILMLILFSFATNEWSSLCGY